MCTYVVGFMYMNQNPGVGSTCACPQSTHFFLLDKYMLQTCSNNSMEKRWKTMETLASAFSGPFSVSAESNGSWHKRVVDMSPISGQKEIQKPLFDAFWASMCSMFYSLQGLPTLANSTAWKGKPPVTKYTYLLWIPQIPNIMIYTDIYIYSI